MKPCIRNNLLSKAHNSGLGKTRKPCIKVIYMDILKPLINAFRKRVVGVPMHFDHAIFLNLKIEICYSSTLSIGLMARIRMDKHAGMSK